MTLEEFQASLAADQPQNDLTAALTGLWWDGKGEWARAHQSVQQGKDAAESWVHAYLHRKEGDEGNASYWYGRAEKSFCDESLETEWLSITKELLKRS